MKITGIFIVTFLSFSCFAKNSTLMRTNNLQESFLLGSYDNFQQVWLENTEDDMHRVAIDEKHLHIHLKILKSTKNAHTFDLEMYQGRNNEKFLGKKEIRFDEDNLSNAKSRKFSSLDGSFQIHGDTLLIDGLGLAKERKDEFYRLVRCRYFSGWFRYPIGEKGDSVHLQANLEIHDQGGMVQCDMEENDYTVELTQLVYGKKIKILKIAIYDLPLSEVGINSKSISYAWTNPEAKRLGINLRKILSGWTLIEPDFVNTNTMIKEKKNE